MTRIIRDASLKKIQIPLEHTTLSILGIESWSLPMLGKCPTSELHLYPYSIIPNRANVSWKYRRTFICLIKTKHPKNPGFHRVILGGLELSVSVWLTSNSQRSSCLCVLTRPEACGLRWLTRELLSLAPVLAGLRQLLRGGWGFKSLCLHGKCSYPLNHLPSQKS